MDADAIARDAVCRLLEYRRWHVVAAATLHQARAAIDHHAFACIVLDLELPDGRGTELLELVRQRRLPVRVVIVTGATDPDRLERVRDLEPDALFQKPADPDQLLNAIDR